MIQNYYQKGVSPCAWTKHFDQERRLFGDCNYISGGFLSPFPTSWGSRKNLREGEGVASRVSCFFFLLPVREVIRFFPLLLCTGPLVLEFNWCEDKFKKQISWHCCNLWKSVSHMIGENWFGPSFPTAPRPVSQRGANHCVTCYTMWLIVVQDYQNFVNLVKSLLPVTTVLVLVKCFIG